MCMKIIAVFIFLICSAFSFLAFPQCKDISGSASDDVIEKYVLLEDAFKQKNFSAAKGPLNWLLRHSPQFNTNVYIKGVETYNALAAVEKNVKQKNVYIDSVIIIYDLRMKNCGEKENVMGRKAISFFNYYYNDESKAKQMLSMMDEAIDLGGEKVLDGLAENYMQAVRIAKRQKLLSDDEVLERYDKITKIIDLKIQKSQTQNKPVERYQKMHDDNVLILSELVEIDCNFVRTKLGPQFKANPDDLSLAKKVFNFMLKGKCTEDPLWLQAAEKLHSNQKDFGLAKIIGLRYLSMKDERKSSQFFAEALELAKSQGDKAEIMGLQAHLEQVKGEYSKARDLYRKAISLDPGKKEFYERIGDLYLNSFEECKKGKSKAEDRFIFLVAYDMYQKAGETSKMADAKESFPSREEVHEINYRPGDKVAVSCWINEETTIRTRN